MNLEQILTLNNYIEHTLLKPDANLSEIKSLCEEAIENNFKSVCVPPYFVKNAASFLLQHSVKVSTVVGFPMGYNVIPAKVEEVKRAVNDGVDQIEMVVNIAAVKNGDWAYVQNEIDSVSTAAHLKNKKAGIILETGLLISEEIKRLCQICVNLKVDSVKNSTGFNSDGVSVEMVAFLKENAADIPIVASGGIHKKDYALELINAGASVLASSSGVQIIK